MAGLFTLKSGKSGNTQTVDDKGRSLTFSTTEEEELHAITEGRAWNINTGDISLTGATESATLYIKNTGTIDLIIPVLVGIASYSANATGAGDNILIKAYRNPTAGTLISDANDLVALNRNHGSEKPIAATVYSATATGKTITNGSVIIQSRHNPAGRLPLAVAIILRQGSSLAIAITPATGNTAMNYQTAIFPFEREQ